MGLVPTITCKVTEAAKARLRDEPGDLEKVAERVKIVAPPKRCKYCGLRLDDDGLEGYCSQGCFSA